MKKQLLSLATIAILGISFTACGGGEDTTGTVNNDNNDGGDVSLNLSGIVSVTVERGGVYDAKVTDSSVPPKSAKQAEGKNEYTFDSTPTYPIIVKGGWIDVDGDGEMTTDDVELDIEMKSYSKTVTPITTYLAQGDEKERAEKLTKLMNDFSMTEDELLEVPSKATTDNILVNNAIYKAVQENNDDLETLSVESINTSYNEVKTIYEQSANKDASSSELALYIEEQILNNLEAEVKSLTEDKIDEIETERESLNIDAKTVFAGKKISTKDSIENEWEYWTFNEDGTEFEVEGDDSEGPLTPSTCTMEYNGNIATVVSCTNEDDDATHPVLTVNNYSDTTINVTFNGESKFDLSILENDGTTSSDTQTDTSDIPTNYKTSDLAGSWNGAHFYTPSASNYSLDSFLIDNSQWEIQTNGETTQSLIEADGSIGDASEYTFILDDTSGQFTIQEDNEKIVLNQYLNSSNSIFSGVTGGEENGLVIGVKTADSYNLSELEGTWRQFQLATPSQSGEYCVELKNHDFDSSGVDTMSQMYSSDDGLDYGTTTFSGIGTDGQLQISGEDSGIFVNNTKDIMIKSSQYSDGNQIEIYVKTALSYSNKDLEGTWYISTLVTPSIGSTNTEKFGYQSSKVIISNSTDTGVDIIFTDIEKSSYDMDDESTTIKGIPMTLSETGYIYNNMMGDDGIDEYSYMNASKDVIVYIGNDVEEDGDSDADNEQYFSVWVKQAE